MDVFASVQNRQDLNLIGLSRSSRGGSQPPEVQESCAADIRLPLSHRLPCKPGPEGGRDARVCAEHPLLRETPKGSLRTVITLALGAR